MRFYTLGDTAIEVGGTRLGPTSVHTFAAALYLGVERDRRVSRATLQGLLYPKSSEANASHSLRQLVYKLKQLSVPLDADGESVMLPGRCIVDDYTTLVRAERLTTSELRALQGGFLPGYSPSFSSAYADWCDAFRTRVTLQLRRILVEQMSELRRRGEWRDLDLAARACLALDPLNEEGTLALAEALAMTGSKVEALKFLDGYSKEVQLTDRRLTIAPATLRSRISEPHRLNSDVGFADTTTALIGRATEFESICSHLWNSVKGRASVVLLEGPQGIGKTRLSVEVCRAAALQGVYVARVACKRHEELRPLAPISRLVEQLLSMPGSVGCSPESMKCLEALARARTYERDGLAARDSQHVAATITNSVVDLVDAVLQEAPLLLFVDDAQWMDSSSVRVLREIFSDRRRRVFLLAAGQSGHFGNQWKIFFDWTEEHEEITRVSLGPLGRDACITLLRWHLGSAFESDAEILDWCATSCGGNPLFIGELARHHRADGPRFTFPPTLTDLLARRVAHLDREELLVLAAVALLDAQGDVGLLRAALELPTHTLAKALQSLEAHGFVLASKTSVSSAHSLTSGAALAAMQPGARGLITRSVAAVLESSGRDTGNVASLWRAADLWNTCGEKRRAYDLLRSCAGHSCELGQPVAAQETLLRALDLTSDAKQRLSTHRELIRVAELAGDYHSVINNSNALSKSGYVFDSPTDCAEAAISLATATFLIGREVDEHNHRLRQLAEDARLPIGMRLHALRLIVIYAEHALDRSSAHDAYSQATRVAADVRADDSLMAPIDLVFHTAFGEHERGIAAANALIPIAWPTFSDPAQESRLYNVAFALFRLGAVEQAFAIAEQLYSKSLAQRITSSEHRAAGLITTMCFEAGKISEARVWLARAEDSERRMSSGQLVAGYRSNAIRLALIDGKPKEAQEILDSSLSAFPSARTGRNAMIARAYALRIRLLNGEAERVSDAVEALLADHRIGRMFGMHDDVAEAVCTGLVACGRPREACKVMEEYLGRWRRDRYPASRALVSFVSPDV